MKNILKNLGVFTTTGVMAVIGMVMGSIVFKPENVIIKSNEASSKESE